jgi:hypothetical protein
MMSPSPYGGTQVDLSLEPSAQRQLDLEVMDGPVTVYASRLRLGFSKPEPLRYSHRIDLLPGSYRLLFTADGAYYPYVIDVPNQVGMSPVFRADESVVGAGRHTPFEFDGRRWDPNPGGSVAVVSLPGTGKVTWTIRRGAQAVWRSASEGIQAAVVQLPLRDLAPGTYRLEAATDFDSQSCELAVRPGPTSFFAGALVSFNANLAPALRLASLGHQWLLRGEIAQARKAIEASLASGVTPEAQIEMARLEALNGNLDTAREIIRRVLNADANNFEALSVFAYIEVRFKDYPVAAEYYRRALALQDSPSLRLALEKLPQ